MKNVKDYFMLPVSRKDIDVNQSAGVSGVSYEDQELAAVNAINHITNLANALDEVLRLPRGSSGRIIIDADMEINLKNKLDAYNNGDVL